MDDQILEKGQLERSKEEDERLKAQAVTYTQFNDLADFDADHPFTADNQAYWNTVILDKIRDPEEWNLQFEALNDFRRINKHHQKQMIAHLPQFAQFLKDSVANLRSGISKNSLMFLNEFFKSDHCHHGDTSSEAVTRVIEIVLPSVILKTNYEKVFISREAKEVLTVSISKCVHVELLDVLLNFPQHKILALLETIYGFIGLFVKAANKEFFDMKSVSDDHKKTLATLVQALSKGLDETPRIKKHATEDLKFLMEKTQNEDEFMQLLEYGLTCQPEGNEEMKEDGPESPSSAPKIKKIMEIFNKKVTKAPVKKDFRSFLKQQKQVGATVAKSEDLIVVQEKQEDTEMKE